MKGTLTLLIQKVISGKSSSNYAKKVEQIIALLEKEGWSVNIEDEQECSDSVENKSK